MDIEQEVQKIRERNEKVEADKAWETSLFRKMLVALITYAIASIVLYTVGVPNFYFAAIVPTLGFLLSTLTLPFIKKWWIQNYFGK